MTGDAPAARPFRRSGRFPFAAVWFAVAALLGLACGRTGADSVPAILARPSLHGLSEAEWRTLEEEVVAALAGAGTVAVVRVSPPAAKAREPGFARVELDLRSVALARAYRTEGDAEPAVVEVATQLPAGACGLDAPPGATVALRYRMEEGVWRAEPFLPPEGRPLALAPEIGIAHAQDAGRAVVAGVDVRGFRLDGDDGPRTLWVEIATGRPLRLERQGATPETLEFRYGERFVIAAPDAKLPSCVTSG